MALWTLRSATMRPRVRMFRHFCGTAGAWGGLPEKEAYCLNVERFNRIHLSVGPLVQQYPG
jgi:hypothetical protein